MKARSVSHWVAYSLLLVFLMVVVNPGVRSGPATYFGVTFPHGDAAFADRVVAYVAASCVRDAYDNPEKALGPPDAVCGGCDACNGCDTNAVSLGFRLSELDNRGYLIVEFVDNVLVDVPGDDLFIYNTNQNPARVEISSDGASFIFVGEVVGYPGAIDIAPYIQANQTFHYVRVSDVPADEDHSNCPGPSIDAIGAMGTAEVVLTGSAFGSLTLTPVGELAFAFDRRANTVFILLDISSSMGEIIDGEVKMDIAKDVLLDLLQRFPEGTVIGIREFGGNCHTELIAPVGPIQHDMLRSAILAIEPQGATPIALALEETQGDLAQIAEPQLILLISDGIETCGGDPVEAARNLVGLGYDLKIHVVGFDVSSNFGVQARDQLIEIARSSGGVFYSADTREELSQALSLAAPFSYAVYDDTGTVVFRGQLGDVGPQLPTGTYTIVIDTAPPITLSNIVVREQQTTTIRVEQANGGYEAEVGN
jgi:hypothetical protein